MSAWAIILAGALVACAVSWLGARIAQASGPVHVPAMRSNHKAPTPSGGGLGVAAGTFGGLLLAAVIASYAGQGLQTVWDGTSVLKLVGLTVLGAGVCAIGLFDDLYDWIAWPKFVILALLSILAAQILGAARVLPVGGEVALVLPILLAIAGSGLWVFTAVNATNFMDGSNGLAASALGVASAGLAVAAGLAGAWEAALAAAVLAGALAGFLPVNAPRGAVFMGDVGSLFIGLWYAAAGLLFIVDAPAGAFGAVYLPPLLLLPILADVLLTLASRARRGEQLFKAHREHAYQRRIDAGESHPALARSTALRAGLLAVLGVAAYWTSLQAREPGFMLAALVAGAAAATFWQRRDRAVAAARREVSAAAAEEHHPGEESRQAQPVDHERQEADPHDHVHQ